MKKLLAAFGVILLWPTHAHAANNSSFCLDATQGGGIALGSTTCPSAPTINANGLISNGTKFTTSGCSVSATTGGATAGKFTVGANTCTVVVTMNGATGLTAPNGWACHIADTTSTTVLVEQSATNATTASFSVPVTAGTTDVFVWGCIAF